MSDRQKVALLKPAQGGWTLTNKETGEIFAFVGENQPVADYLPEGWKVEEDLKNDYKQEA